jgi:hypothetical protein
MTLLLVFGLLFAFGMPPCQVADETDHFVHAYDVSQGHFVPALVDGAGGGTVPVSLKKLCGTFRYLAHSQGPIVPTSFAEAWAIPLEPDRVCPVPYISSCYSCVPYLPQASGIALARALGAGPLVISYAGRLANLGLAAVLVFLAIRVVPFFKLVFGCLALLPITVHQFASNSPDASTIAVAFLLSACLLRLAFEPVAANSWRTIVLVFVLTAWLTLCKFPYAVIILLMLAVPAARLGGWRRYSVITVGLFAVTLGLALAMTAQKRFVPDRIAAPGLGVSIDRQCRRVLTHPEQFAQVCALTVAECGGAWIDQLGVLGWLNTPVNRLAMQGFFVLVVVVALGDRRAGFVPSHRARVAALLAVAGGTLMIFFCNYLCGDPVRAPIIHGISGRYFVPLLPLLALPLYCRSLQVRVSSPLLFALAGSGCTAILVVAVACLVRRYYFAPELEGPVSALALLSGLCLVAGSTAWTRKGFHASRSAMAPRRLAPGCIFSPGRGLSLASRTPIDQA